MRKMQLLPPEVNGLWGYDQVASFLQISRSKAKRLPIPCVKIGRSVRFFPERVREWANGHSVPANQEGSNG
jgi:predicted DNA-binding transcriptional regulator AlpA